MKKFGGNYKIQALVLAIQFILIVSNLEIYPSVNFIRFRFQRKKGQVFSTILFYDTFSI